MTWPITRYRTAALGSGWGPADENAIQDLFLRPNGRFRGDDIAQVFDITGVNTYTVSGLDGNVDRAYEFTLTGRIANASAAKVITLKPNNLATNISASYVFEDGNSTSFTNRTDFLLAQTTNDSTAWDFIVHGSLSAKTGRKRVLNISSTSIRGITGGASKINLFGGGGWDEQATNLTSLVFDFNGVNVTDGELFLRRLRGV